MIETRQTLWQWIRGDNSRRVAFLIATVATFLIVFSTIANSGQEFETSLCLVAAIFSLSGGVLAGNITVCIRSRDERHRTWNEPRRFLLFLMLVCFMAFGGI